MNQKGGNKNRERNLKALKPFISFAEFFKQEKTVLASHNSHVSAQCLNQRLFVAETSH